MKLKGIGLFALGTLFGLEGIKLLSSKDVKKVYAHCTAGVLRIEKDYFEVIYRTFCEAQVDRFFRVRTA